MLYMAKRKKKQNTQPFWRLVFLLYAALMFWLLFCRSWGWSSDQDYWQIVEQNLCLKPFDTITRYANIILYYPHSSSFTHCFINLVGNVVMFIPAGWLLPRIFQKQRHYLIFLLTCFLTILLVETVQLFTLLGCFDVDDIILNLAGMTLGYLLCVCRNK